MAINPLKAFLYLAGGAGAAVGGAYVTGVIDMLNAPQTAVEAPAEQPKAAAVNTEPVDPKAPAKAAEPAIAAPSFDVLRVEPDGSVVIAGKAAAGSEVEVVVDGVVVAKGKADAGGDFAIVLEKPLAPGDHQIVLVAKVESGVSVQSIETATVSVPETPGGEVLAMVEEPGKPSEIISMPKPAEDPAKPAEVAAAEPAKPVEVAAADPAKPAEAAAAPANLAVAIKAVEIEGRKVFVAGAGQPGYLARIYFDDALLGESAVQADGGFVVEAERDIAVGPHAVRADLVNPKDGLVVARGQVPFEREAGEQVAAVAPEPAPEPAKPAEVAADPAKPAEVAAADPAKPAEVAAADPAKPAEVAAADPAKPAEAAAADPAKPAEAAAADPAPAVESPKLVPVQNAVIIRKGDTLWRISRRVYGRGVRFSTIYTANSGQIQDPDRIWPGQVFTVPGKSDAGEEADMSAVADQMAPKEPAAQ